MAILGLAEKACLGVLVTKNVLENYLFVSQTVGPFTTAIKTNVLSSGCVNFCLQISD
jgi:hypothetical protein